MILTDKLSSIANVRHGFFTRNRPGETFGNRNCAYRANDDETAVDRNRSACAEAVGTTLAHLITVKQRHTADVMIADAPMHCREAPIADAIVSTTPGLSLGVLTADCAPVLLADKSGKVIAAAHAGWRGAFDGVLENTVAKMESLGTQRANIVAAVGPCIGQASYEVGPEFIERFVAKDTGFARYFTNRQPNGHCYFDLAAFAADRLRAAHVGEVIITGQDTCAEEATLFSYRRSVQRKEPDYGRQLSAIAIALDR